MRARRVALIADVHSNAPALAAVLREVEAETIAAYRRTDDPSREPMVEMLEQPPTPEELIADAEKRVFWD